MSLTKLVLRYAAPLPDMESFQRTMFIGHHTGDIEIGAVATDGKQALKKVRQNNPPALTVRCRRSLRDTATGTREYPQMESRSRFKFTAPSRPVKAKPPLGAVCSRRNGSGNLRISR